MGQKYSTTYEMLALSRSLLEAFHQKDAESQKPAWFSQASSGRSLHDRLELITPERIATRF